MSLLRHARVTALFFLFASVGCVTEAKEPEAGCTQGSCVDAGTTHPAGDAARDGGRAWIDAKAPLVDAARVEDAATYVESDADPGTVIPMPSDQADFVFDQSAVRRYNLVIAEQDLAKLNADPAAEEYVEAHLEFEGQTYGPLGVRYKGSIGAFLSPCTLAFAPGQATGAKVGKCSIKIDFNHVDDDARFYGLKQLNLHAMGQDRSQLRDRLGYALFRENGIPAPRAMHAMVSINGKVEGLFVAVEEIDKDFTKGRFSEGGKGNLYKERWPATDDPDYYRAGLKTNEDEGHVEKMLAFHRAVAGGDARIAHWLDRDYMARFLAVDRVIINDDGSMHWYCGMPGNASIIYNHNYYWYEASKADRMWLLPWDLDSSFAATSYVHIDPAWNATAACTCSGNPAQQPSTCDPLIADWASWSMSTNDYESAVASFLAGPFAAANVDAKLDAWTAQIDALTQQQSGLNGAPLYFIWQASVSSLRTTIEDARAHHGYGY